MKPDSRFVQQTKEFWAHVRTISQSIGYVVDNRTGKKAAAQQRQPGPVKVPTAAEVLEAFRLLGLNSDHFIQPHDQQLTTFGATLLAYFTFRADVLNAFVASRLMKVAQARQNFLDLYSQLSPTCLIPMNKQKGEKRAPQFFTGIINMLVEANAGGHPVDYNPGALTTITRNDVPVRTLSRRVDGAFTSTVNPIAAWEVKEYYYTTTFGSRVADSVYETLVDGMELEELRQERGIDIQHLLMVDDHFTWWVCGRSYLCRIIDMLHMGYVDEMLFGAEVVERIPTIVQQWVAAARAYPDFIRGKPLTSQQRRTLAKTHATVRNWVSDAVQHPDRLPFLSDTRETDPATDEGDAVDEIGELNTTETDV